MKFNFNYRIVSTNTNEEILNTDWYKPNSKYSVSSKEFEITDYEFKKDICEFNFIHFIENQKDYDSDNTGFVRFCFDDEVKVYSWL